jgi:chromosome segregation ATPase
LIEAVMYFVLGALAAGLLTLTLLPAIWRRAARLTKARVESSVPLSLAEIRAGKDQLRAEFALTTRRLEIDAARFEEKATTQLVDINRKRDEIAHLNAEQAARAEAIRQLEANVAKLSDDIRLAEKNLGDADSELAARGESLAERAARIGVLEGELGAAMQLTEEQQLELIARDTEIGNLRDQVAAGKASEASLSHIRNELSAALAGEKARLAREEQRGEGLVARIAALEAERIDRIAVLEMRAAEMKEYQAEIALEHARRDVLAAEIGRLESERDDAVAGLARRSEEMERMKTVLIETDAKRRHVEQRLAVADASLAAARAEIASLVTKAEVDAMSAGDNLRKALAVTEAEKTALQGRVLALEDEHAALRGENAELRRISGAEWENEREENARLRDRLTLIAADVVRWTQNSGGGGGGVASAHVAEEMNGSGNGNGAGPRKLPAPRPSRPPAETPAVASDEVTARPIEGKTLAERIRALQHSAARH